MFWYLLNIFFIVIAWFMPLLFSKSKVYASVTYQNNVLYTRKKIVCVIATINWIFLSGFRHFSVGPDTMSYKWSFDNIKNCDWKTLLENLTLKLKFQEIDGKDPGYPIIQKAFQYFTTDYQWFLVFVAILFFVPLGIAIYRFSENPLISYILFSVLFYSFFAITGIRQTLVQGVLILLGTECIKRKKLVLFLILVLLLSTVHSSAICIIPLYWMSRIKINKLTLTMYWVAIVGSFIFRYDLLNLLQNLVGYDSYVDYEGAGAFTFTAFLMLFALFVTVFYKTIANDEFISKLSVNALFISAFFSSLLLINPSCMRVVQYFSVYMLFLLPICRKAFKNTQTGNIFDTGIVFVLLFLLVRNNPTYLFFWQTP